jgi:hypothetical protein
MWIFSLRGFYSVVRARGGAWNVQVRARVREDLEALPQHLWTGRIRATPEADYPFRVVMSTRRWSTIVSYLADESAGYTNFKDAVARQDAKRAKLYEKLWSELRELEGPDGWAERHAASLLREPSAKRVKRPRSVRRTQKRKRVEYS